MFVVVVFCAGLCVLWCLFCLLLLFMWLLLLVVGLVCCIEATNTPQQKQTSDAVVGVVCLSFMHCVCDLLSWVLCSGLFSLLLRCFDVCLFWLVCVVAFVLFVLML